MMGVAAKVFSIVSNCLPELLGLVLIDINTTKANYNYNYFPLVITSL